MTTRWKNILEIIPLWMNRNYKRVKLLIHMHDDRRLVDSLKEKSLLWSSQSVTLVRNILCLGPSYDTMRCVLCIIMTFTEHQAFIRNIRTKQRGDHNGYGSTRDSLNMSQEVWFPLQWRCALFLTPHCLRGMISLSHVMGKAYSFKIWLFVRQLCHLSH